nr:squalene synthase 1-like [Aegilops tauschii subsp. strangulata]
MGVLSRPEEVPALLRLKLAAGRIRRQIPPQEHWAFAYHMLQRVSRSFALVIQQLGPDLRNAVCVFYLVLRALDTVGQHPYYPCYCSLITAEDDTAIPNEVKLPILRDFYRHIYNPDWLFSCGANDYRVLMDNFRQVSTAFLELGEGYTGIPVGMPSIRSEFSTETRTPQVCH